MSICYIYCIEPTIKKLDDSDVYYGSSELPPQMRHKLHLSKHNFCRSRYLTAKYGADNLSFAILRYCSPAERYIIENEYIANNPCINRNHTIARGKRHYNQTYYYKHIERLKQSRTQCGCGKSYYCYTKSNHLKSKHHLNWVNSQN